MSNLELMRILLMHSVDGVLNGCGNSYVNKYTEEWLVHAKNVGAYHGEVVGSIVDLRYKWQLWLEENELPEIPDVEKGD